MVALVTGANKGIGKEIARGLVAAGAEVFAAARDPERGAAAANEVGARFLQLDVTDAASIEAAVAAVAAQTDRLDVLVNNAAVSGDSMDPPSSAPLAAVRAAFEVNFFGVIAVTNALLPLLRAADRARVVNLGSPLGSLGLQAEAREGEGWPNVLAYNSSKAALNALTVGYARELREAGIAVVSVDPGFTATDLNGHAGTQTTAQGAILPLRAATVPGLPTATFLTGGEEPFGGRLPW